MKIEWFNILSFLNKMACVALPLILDVVSTGLMATPVRVGLSAVGLRGRGLEIQARAQSDSGDLRAGTQIENLVK